MGIANALAATPVSSQDLSRFVSVPASTTVAETVALMSSWGRSCACVVDDGRLVGIFTQRDFVQRIIGRPVTWDRPIIDEASQSVQVIPNTATVADGLALMNEWWIRSVPVIDEDDGLVGNLSFHTVMTTIRNMLAARVGFGSPVETAHEALTMVDFTGLNWAGPAVLHVNESVAKAAQNMRTRGLGSVFVIDDRETLVGELSEFHLQTRVGCTESDLGMVTVGEVCETNLVSIGVRSSIADGLRQILSEEVSYVPLLGGSGRPVGVASVSEIMTYVDTVLDATN